LTVFIEAIIAIADAERIPNKTSTVKMAGTDLVSKKHPKEQ